MKDRSGEAFMEWREADSTAKVRGVQKEGVQSGGRRKGSPTGHPFFMLVVNRNIFVSVRFGCQSGKHRQPRLYLKNGYSRPALSVFQQNCKQPTELACGRLQIGAFHISVNLCGAVSITSSNACLFA